MIQARHLHDAAIAPLAQAFATEGAVRIERAFDEAVAAAALEALRGEAHIPDLHPHEHGYQLWRSSWVPEPACAHDLCGLGRWLFAEGRQLAERVSGLQLGVGEGGVLVSDRHHKGMYVEPYDEADGVRAVAFQVGLTPCTWPAEWGGHVQVLGPDDAVRSSWAPDWNTLDLFDVRVQARRRLPILREHTEGFVISGWYTLES